MSDFPLIIIGGGLSGLAAGIRYARFGNDVLILEKHSKPGGLNSYYTRRGMLLETGLHAVTNYAPPEERHAPLNRLLRQLKISRRSFITHEQFGSRVLFPDNVSLSFSNDFQELVDEVARLFPATTDRFLALVADMDAANPFLPEPRVSARKRLREALDNELLTELLLCPLMYYGSSEENDMDYSQFIIMFRSLFQEGMFRPSGTIKDLLDLLLAHYGSFGGRIRFKSGVSRILFSADHHPRATGVELESGEIITCDALLTTIGFRETMGLVPDQLLPGKNETAPAGRLSFTESIYLLPQASRDKLACDKTITFYNTAPRFNYACPGEAVDLTSGVICFPENFHGLESKEYIQLRVTHLANYGIWQEAAKGGPAGTYAALKEEWGKRSKEAVGKIIGNYRENIVYEDSFTPVTVKKYTGKVNGAIYGSPLKHKDGRTPFANMFIAGTDQGYLGIIGAMLSGVTMVNQHLLT